MEIRPARADEFDALAEPLLRARNEMDVSRRSPTSTPADRRRSSASATRSLGRGGRGRCSASSRSRRSTNATAGRCSRSSTSSRTHQNRGVGTRAPRPGEGAPAGGFYLWVFQKNAGAIRFYERHGFQPREAHRRRRQHGAGAGRALRLALTLGERALGRPRIERAMTSRWISLVPS